MAADPAGGSDAPSPTGVACTIAKGRRTFGGGAGSATAEVLTAVWRLLAEEAGPAATRAAAASRPLGQHGEFVPVIRHKRVTRAGLDRSASARRIALAAAALTGALLASCQDATGPRLGVVVTVSQLVGPTSSADSTGQQRLECQLSLEARSRARSRSAWLDATLSFYGADDSTRVLSTSTVAAADVRSSWGADSLDAGASETAHWRLTGSAPFSMRMLFRYQPAGGPVDSTAVRVSCSPPLGSGPPPTIVTLQAGQTTPLEPGDTLALTYAATSAVGLWQSRIHLGGPCDTTVLLPERLQFTASHRVSIVLPAACALGVPLVVTAATFDTRLQPAQQTLTLPGLVDHTRPTLAAWIGTPYAEAVPVAGLGGYLFAGDVITVTVNAADNHALQAIDRQAQPVGYRDSVRVSGPAGFWYSEFQIPATWVGPVQWRFDARDVSGNVSDTVASALGATEVFPTVGPAPTPTYAMEEVTDATFDGKRGVIYLLESNAYRIAVFSPASRSIVASIALTDYAPAIDLSPGGDSLVTVLMNSHALGVVDLTQAAPALQPVPLPGLDTSTWRLLDIRVPATGRAVLAVQHAVVGGETRLYTYDLATGAMRLRSEVPALASNFPGQLGRSGDGAVIVENDGAGVLARYDAAADAFGPPHATRLVGRPSLDSTGAHVAIVGELYDGALQDLGSVRPAVGLGVISPDGRTHYGPLASWAPLGLARSRVADGSIIDRIAVPYLTSLLRVSPDGSTLLVVGYTSAGSPVGVIDLGQLH